jgi:hypothetical protein
LRLRARQWQIGSAYPKISSDQNPRTVMNTPRRGRKWVIYDALNIDFSDEHRLGIGCPRGIIDEMLPP